MMLAAFACAAPAQSVQDAKALGCFADNRDGDPQGVRGRDLDGAAFRDPSMTVARCLDLCRAQGFRYAGLQDGSACFCGNGYGRYGSGGAVCETACAGDPALTCGGEWANSVWDLQQGAPAPSTGPTAGQAPWLGLQIQNVPDDIAASSGLGAPLGALVAGVTAGGPADRAGLRQGDIVLRFNGTRIANARALVPEIARTRTGDAVEIKIFRDGARQVVTATIGARNAP